MKKDSAFYAKNLVQNIENESLKRKSDTNYGDIYSSSREELALYQYKRYLGSLHYILDAKNMKGFKYNEF